MPNTASRSLLPYCLLNLSLPSSNDSHLEELQSTKSNLLQLSKFCTMDDWGCQSTGHCWSNTSILGHSYPLRLNNTFLDFLSDNALTQISSTPTRGSRHFYHEQVLISDHGTILVKSLITAHLSYPSKRTIHVWSQADFQDIRNKIGLLCEEFTSFTLHLLFFIHTC